MIPKKKKRSRKNATTSELPASREADDAAEIATESTAGASLAGRIKAKNQAKAEEK